MANFPDSPGIGSVFVDSTSGFAYKWTGVVWKSFNAAAGSEQKVLDDISSGFNNSTTTFDLTVSSSAFAPSNAQSLQISLGGVIQEPVTDYTIDGTTITFTTAPNAGLDFFGIVRSTAVNLDFANDGNISTKQQYTATEAQTTFTVTGGYTVDNLDVYRNGVRLRSSTDFTATNGTTFVLTAPASTGDLLESVAYKVASVVVTQGDFTNLNITGVATVGILTGLTSAQAGVFYGDGSGLTGVASTDNIQTATPAKFLNDVSITGVTTVGVVTGGTSISAGVYYGDGSALTGIDASTLKSGSDIKAQAVGTGVVVTGVLTATTMSASNAVFDGNVTVGGTITYQDATSIDVLGIGTFQQGIQVLANGANVTGIVTVGLTTIKTGEIEVTGVVTATTIKAGTAISITDGAVSATRFHGDGSNLTGIDATTLTDSGGNIKVQANPNGIVITGIATATDFDSTSDERLKTNIQVVDGALDKVNRLRGVSFEWKESGEPSYGVIAQELESVLPELVHGDDPKRVNYNGIIGVLIESIKELSARVDELENK